MVYKGSLLPASFNFTHFPSAPAKLASNDTEGRNVHSNRVTNTEKTGSEVEGNRRPSERSIPDSVEIGRDHTTGVQSSHNSGEMGLSRSTSTEHCQGKRTVIHGHLQVPQKDQKEKKRVFGLAKEKTLSYVLPEDYEHRYPPDEFGQEMGPNARVWRVYLDEAELNDRDMVEGWKDGIDVLLVFAGLFSAVVTTFVTQTSQKLDQDFGQISASLLTELVALQRATLAGSAPEDVPLSEFTLSSSPHPTNADIWVNGLWFTSLVLSLITALAAVLIKQWIQHYVSFVSGTPQERARIHQFRYIGLQRWGVHVIIGVLPALIHAALFLFILGLCIFLHPLKLGIACAVGASGAVAFGLYTISNVLPLFYSQCPYYTPLIEHVHSAMTLVIACRQLIFPITHRAIPRLLSRDSFSIFRRAVPVERWCEKLLRTAPPETKPTTLRVFESLAAEHEQDEVVSATIHWLLTMSSNPSVRPIALEAISGLRFGFSRTAELFGREESVTSGLYHELGRRQVGIAHKPGSIATFINTPQFYSIERIIRASMFIPGFSGFLSLNPVDWKTFAKYAPDSSPTCQLALATYHICTPRFIDNPHGFLHTLSTLFHTIRSYPIVWGAWFNLLKDKGSTDLCAELGFRDIYPKLEPLFDTLLNAPYHYETWAVLLPLLRKVLPQRIVQECDDLLDPLYATPNTQITIKYQLCAMLLKGAILECEEDPSCAVEFEYLISYVCRRFTSAALTFYVDQRLIVESLNELISRPFFVHTPWNQDTYTLLFDTYIKAHQSPALPRAFSSHEHLSNLLSNPDCVKGLWGVLFRPSTLAGSHIPVIVDRIVQVLETWSSTVTNDLIIQNVFATFLEIHWIQDHIASRDTASELSESNHYRYSWPSQTQPLVRWMLAHAITCSGSLGLQSNSSIHTFATKLIEQPAFLAITCGGFFIDETHGLTFSTHSDIVLQLAAHHHNKSGARDAWRQLLSWIKVQSIRLHADQQRDSNWTRPKYE